MPDSPNPCASWDEDLSALHDGELAPARVVEVRAHVEGCARCSARLGALRRVDSLLAEAPQPEVPASLREATLTRLAAQADAAAERPAPRRGPPSSAPSPERRRSLRAPAIGAALAAAAALALYLLGRPTPEVAPVGPAQPPIAVEPTPPLPEESIDEPPPVLIVEPLPPPAFPPPPEPEVPDFVPELAPPDPVLALEAEPAEDLAVVLFGAEQPDDFDVIANLEILERLIELEEGRG